MSDLASELLEGRYQGPGHDSLALIRRHFPEKYSDFFETLRNEPQPSDEYIIAAINNLQSSVSTENIGYLAYASDPKLVELARQFHITFQALQTDIGTCNRFAVEGVNGLTPEIRLQNSSNLQRLDVIMLNAMIDGRFSGGNRKVASESDWEAFGVYWMNNGGTQSHAVSLSNIDPNDPILCSAMISLYQSATDAVGPEAERIRATLFVE